MSRYGLGAGFQPDAQARPLGYSRKSPPALRPPHTPGRLLPVSNAHKGAYQVVKKWHLG